MRFFGKFRFRFSPRSRAPRASLLLLSLVLPSGLMLAAAAAPQSGGKRAKKPAAKSARAAGDIGQAAFRRDVQPMVKKFCVGCHGAKNPAGGVSLVGFDNAASVVKSRDLWERVSRAVGSSTMPPQGMPAPSQAERAKAAHWIDAAITQADCKLDDPGRVTMRRLNREEYNNTIRDLVGVNFRPADGFPSDDVGYGFDNIGDVLSLSPLLMEKYMAAAERIADAAILTPEERSQPTRMPANKLVKDGQPVSVSPTGAFLYSNAELTFDYEFPTTTEYTLSAEAYQQKAGPEDAKMAFLVDGKPVREVSVAAAQKKPETYSVKVTIEAGRRKIGVAFTNDYFNEQSKNGRDRDRNLGVNWIEIQAPPEATAAGALPTTHKRIFTVTPTAANREQAARKILADFLRRAWRRPVSADEASRLARIVQAAQKNGDSFERGIELAMQGALVSPNFLFRVELDAKPNDAKAKRLLNGYEMASRLSYFLWSSMPDEELFRLAAKNRLQDPKILAAQVKRMLKDPKAKALADNFAGQWLQLRNLNTVSPDTARFPAFTEKLRQAMRTETELFFQAIVKEDRSILDFLDGKFTYLNAALAKHYGIPGVEGDNFRRVALATSQRGGILTQASVLTVTSNPTRTSPVKRGKWVLEQLLGTPPLPPPPNVPQLADDRAEAKQLEGTLRQRMEQHRKNPACASCHARMDAIGFGLENYDPIGAWRAQDGGQPVDSSGTLPGGRSFKTPAELKTILKSQKDQFARSLTEKMLTYALGRGIETYDRCNIDAMEKTIAKQNYKISALVTAVVHSEPFRKRRGDGG